MVGPKANAAKLQSDARRIRRWRQRWRVSVCGYFPSLSASSSLESVDHGSYSALASQTPRSQLCNIRPLPCPLVPVSSTSPSSVRVFDIGDNASSLDVGVFRQCRSAKSKAIKKRKKPRVNLHGKVFHCCNYEGGLIFGPTGLYFPLYGSHSPLKRGRHQ